jgi:hypothetical protein
MTNREIAIVATLAQTMTLVPLLLSDMQMLDLDGSGVDIPRALGVFVTLAIQLHVATAIRDWVVQQLSKRQKHDVPTDGISS